MLNLHEPHGQFGIPDLWQFSDTLTPVWACRVVRDTRVQRSVDRNLFRSSRGARHSQECSTLSNRFNLCENCYKSSSEQVNCGSAVGYPLPYLFTPGVTPWERGRPARVASLRAGCSRSQEKCERLPFTSTPSDSVCVFSRAAISVIAGRERAGTPAHPAGTWCNPAAGRYRASGRRRCRCPRWRQRPQRGGLPNVRV